MKTVMKWGMVSIMILFLTACGGSTNPPDTNGTDTNTTNTTGGSGSGGGQTGGNGGSGGNTAQTDTTPPVITLNGSSIVYLQRGLDYTDIGAHAEDETDGDISSSITISNPVNKDLAGTYIVTYTVSDAAGNAATAVSRTVKVVNSIVKQTVQTKSFDEAGNEAGLRDDGYYQSGVAPDYVRTGDVVYDRITGLTWQDDTIVRKTYDEGKAYCASLSLGGYEDWRLPDIRELLGITRHFGDAIPSVFHARDVTTNYWSDTLFDANQSKVWGISPVAATDVIMPRAQSKNIRCVRGTPAAHQSLTRDDTHAIVFDPNTGLEWQDNVPVLKHWEAALSYCRSLSLDGGNWRLPSYNELYMLLDRTQADAMDAVFQVRRNHSFWTATTYKDKTTDALIIEPSQGVDKWFGKGANFYVRCVRTRGVDLAAQALAVITHYAATNGSSPALELSTYQDAGITGVSAANLSAVNSAVANATEDAADSAAEVQQIVNDTVAASIPMPTLSVQYHDGHSGEMYVDVNNIDTTELSKLIVYRNTSDDIGGKVPVHTLTPPPGSSIEYIEHNLAGCQEYYYWIEACVDQSGTEICRIDTQPAHDKTVPEAPQNMKVYAQIIRSLNMQWQNNSDNGCTVKYHIYKRTTPSGAFVQIPEINDLTSGTDGATATNVNAGVYIHYRVQAEDGDGRKSSLSCTVANGYPQYGVASAQDACRAAVGYTWGDQPHYPWASYNGYTDKVIFTWDDVVIELNDNGTVKTYANAYSVKYRVGSGSWQDVQGTVQNPFTQNGVQYQAFTLTNMSPNTTAQLQVRTMYKYDNNGDGTPELTYSTPITITGKTAASSSTTSSLGTPPAATASTYYPGKIMVGWTSSSGAHHYKLYYKTVSSSCGSDAHADPTQDGYAYKLSTTSTTYNDMVSWTKRCYRVEACDASNHCTAAGSHAYGSSTGN